jgi:glycosyltransferase involved in cell wall biosynthesis
MDGADLKIIFINYGLFESNSGGHIANFANQLVMLGHKVAVCALGPTDGLQAYGKTRFKPIQIEELEFDARAVSAFDGVEATPEDTLIHCWTPRERVRLMTDLLLKVAPFRYIVHLEDNEEVITASQMQRTWKDLLGENPRILDIIIPYGLSHPIKYQHFLSASSGATVIVDKLGEFVPHHVPVHVLEPGVDSKKFSPSMAAAKRRQLLEALDVDPKAKVLVYHGNMHGANQREIFSLYTAVAILRRRKVNVVLLRAGRNFTDGLDVSFQSLSEGVIDLGFLDDSRLLEVLKLADAYVQPGAADEFNVYRLPSKLPEFLSLGKPVLLPFANIAHKLEDGVNAVILRKGDGAEIADKLINLLGDKPLAKTIGQNGRLFAKGHLDWKRKASSLEVFYGSVLAAGAVKKAS